MYHLCIGLVRNEQFLKEQGQGVWKYPDGVSGFCFSLFQLCFLCLRWCRLSSSRSHPALRQCHIILFANIHLTFSELDVNHAVKPHYLIYKTFLKRNISLAAETWNLLFGVFYSEIQFPELKKIFLRKMSSYLINPPKTQDAKKSRWRGIFSGH